MPVNAAATCDANKSLGYAVNDNPLTVTACPAFKSVKVMVLPLTTGESGILILANAVATSVAVLVTSAVYFKPPTTMVSPGFMALKVTADFSMVPNEPMVDEVDAGVPATTCNADVLIGSEMVL